MSTSQIRTKAEEFVNQFDDMIYNGTVDNKFVNNLQIFLDKADEITKDIVLPREELSILYELQALIFATRGESKDSDAFIVEAVILSGGEQYLKSSVIRDYIQDYDLSDVPRTVAPKDLPFVLSNDPKVVDSMIYIQRAGFWSTVIGILLLPLSLLFLIISSVNAQLLFLLLISFYFIYVGIKLNKLEGRSSIIGWLVSVAVLSVYLGLTVLPLISFIMSVIALLKIKHYQRWRLEKSGDFIQAIKS